MSASDSSTQHIWASRRNRVAEWTDYKIKLVPAHLERMGPLFAIVASHQSRHPEWTFQWRHRILTALKSIGDSNGVVIFSSENSIGCWIKEFASRLNVPSLELIASSTKHHRNATINAVLFEPQCEEPRETSSELAKMPLVDRLIYAMADSIHAISVRSGSKTEYLLSKWIDDRSTTAIPARLFIYEHESKPHSIPPSIDCIHVGDDRAYQSDVPRREDSYITGFAMQPSAVRKLAKGYSNCVAPIVSHSTLASSQLNSDEYLVHCTRGRGGPLPLQSHDSYVNEVLLESKNIDSSPLDNLLSILSQRRIAATSFLKKNKSPSVSFSNVPLLELLKRRQYQSHLQRWDWEPYGLAVRRLVLVQDFAAQAVIYTDNVIGIPEDKIWLTQPASESRSNRDWSAEKEWRVPADIRLAKIDFTDAFVFVPTSREANLVSHISPFPIVIVK